MWPESVAPRRRHEVTVKAPFVILRASNCVHDACAKSVKKPSKVVHVMWTRPLRQGLTTPRGKKTSSDELLSHDPYAIFYGPGDSICGSEALKKVCGKVAVTVGASETTAGRRKHARSARSRTAINSALRKSGPSMITWEKAPVKVAHTALSSHDPSPRMHLARFRFVERVRFV